jgi:alanine transaminase
MYAYPKVLINDSAVLAAEKAGFNVDTYYCKYILEETGIILVPGTGFGQ